MIGKSETKTDALSHATGSSLFVDDFELKNPLYLALLYSPHAHARILSIDDSKARKVPGVADVFHFGNVKPILHTTAGQGFPEPSPYDSVLFDKKMRFVGDRVAMVAAETQEIAEAALKLIKVEYEELEPLFDAEKAMEPGAPLLFTGDEHAAIPVKYEPQRNLAAEVTAAFGDLQKAETESDFIFEERYQTQYASHCAIEPHVAMAKFDEMGRLIIIASTQVPFHARRIVSKVCEMPISKIRVIKPRIGGGFGGKQEVLLEPLVALATLRLKRPSKLILSRKEVFQSSRTRHPVRTKLRMGAKKSGEITFIDMDTLLNSGAYGSHALTVLSNAGAKVLPLLNKVSAARFFGQSVYTNLPVGGAYRGYGATQGYFALNVHLDIIARKLNLDLPQWLKSIHIREGETSEIFKALGEGTEGVEQIIHSCKLDECIDLGVKEIDWYAKRDKKITTGDKVSGVGMMIGMQGSAIPLIDMGAAYMKMNDDGSFNLNIGATDIGTGSDTILAQIAAEVLTIPLEKIIVLSSDTDQTPFDVGAYASSTTYLTGGAVKKCAEAIREQIMDVAADMLKCDKEKLSLENETVTNTQSGKSVSLAQVGTYSFYTHNQKQIQAGASKVVEQSPPPFIAHFVELTVDKKTGDIDLQKVVTAVDCGQAINPQLAEGQVEGAVVNALSYALTEEYKFSESGNLLNKSFHDYKIFSAVDIPEMKTFIVQSHEITGPFGAKSVGEIGMNGSIPAVANAIYDAVGVRLFEPPFTADKVYKAMKKVSK
ncbi:MAG TPA: aldehyde oxidase [Candidatus Marinimicrobia bacterium]|nr:aldehyde oxidase [Candidatus Neomarinimicrobiota bacterium]